MFSVAFYLIIGFIILLAVFIVRQYRLQRRLAERRAQRADTIAHRKGDGDA